MKSKFFLQLITAVLLIIFKISPLQALPVAPQEAREWANQTGYRLIEALGNPDIEAKHQILDRMFNEDVDTAYLARFVIGRYWKNLNDTEKQTYMALFKRYVLALYKTYPLDFSTESISFEILSAQVNGNFTDVACRVNLPEDISNGKIKNIRLDFKLSQNAGKIKITDLKIGESSLLVTYRARFYAMIKDVDEEMSWFLEDFETLTVSTERTAAESLN